MKTPKSNKASAFKHTHLFELFKHRAQNKLINIPNLNPGEKQTYKNEKNLLLFLNFIFDEENCWTDFLG